MAALTARAGDSPIDRLLPRLEGVKATGADRYVAKCSGHDDKRPSLTIRALPDGRILVHCWAGCSAAEIVHGAGLTLADLFPPRPPEHHAGPIPTRSRWDRAAAWQCVAHEAAVAAVVAADAAAGRLVTADDAERAGLAADRLADAVHTLGLAR